MFMGHRVEIQVLQAQWPFTTYSVIHPFSLSLSPPTSRRPKKASIQDAAVREGRGGLFDLEGGIVSTPVPPSAHIHAHSLVVTGMWVVG